MRAQLRPPNAVFPVRKGSAMVPSNDVSETDFTCVCFIQSAIGGSEARPISEPFRIVQNAQANFEAKISLPLIVSFRRSISVRISYRCTQSMQNHLQKRSGK